jgi:hypothetical protein
MTAYSHNGMPHGTQLGHHFLWYTVLNSYSAAAAAVSNAEARHIQAALGTHAKVHQVEQHLYVPLGLHEPPHDSEGGK